MNGFPLVLLGVVLFAVAYGLIKIQSRMKDVTKAIDAGFKTLEDGITQNLLGPTGALTKASSAVDQSYLTVKTGVDNNIFGPSGLLSNSRHIMSYADNICNQIGDDIHDGKLILQNDIRKTTGDIETLLQDSGTPLINAGVWFNNIGNNIDIEILGEHPFRGLAQPFRDVGNTVDSVGDKCIEAKLKLMAADQKIILAENALQDMSVKVKSLGGEILQVSDYIDTTFTTGINTSLGQFKQVTDSVKTLFSTLENGAQTSVNNLENANRYLNSLLINLFQKRLIIGLAAAGVALILAGVAIGI